MELLTISRIKSYRACARRHHHEYVESVRPVADAPALRFGTVIHSVLEAYWRARQNGETATDAAFTAFDTLRDLGSRLDAWEEARASAMVAAYTIVWGNQNVSVIAVEHQWQMPLVNPDSGCASQTFELAGKIDLILGLADGRVAIVEHKTTSSDPGAGSEYRDRLVMDGQISLYFQAAEALGLRPDVCIYDVLVKPAVRPLKATPIETQKRTRAGALYAGQRAADETVAEYQQRVCDAVAAAPERHIVQIEVPRLESEWDESTQDVWVTATRMREDAYHARIPRNPDACHRYGSVCPYHPVCTHRASISDPTLYQIARKHPELQRMPAAVEVSVSVSL